MPRKRMEPRFVSPASIDVGDTIRVVWKDRDRELSITGVVGNIHGRTLSTPEGALLFTWDPNVKLHRVTLLDKAEAPQAALFGAELLEEVNKRLV